MSDIEGAIRPLVSVLLASRNGQRFLPEALQGISAQTYPAIETILVDDGSEDGTAAILERFAAEHPRTRVLRAPGIGLAAALAIAAREANGDYFARHDDDDRSHPERIERQVSYLEAHPGVGVLGTAANTIDTEGRRIGIYPVPLSPEAIRRTLRRAVPFAHGSVMMRRSAYEAAGGYRGAFRASQDYDLWLRVPADAGLANLPEPLYEWRLHPSGVFSRTRLDQMFFAAVARTFADERRARGRDSVDLLALHPDPADFLEHYPGTGRLSFYFGEALAREGRAKEARHYLGRALHDPEGLRRAVPWWILTWLLPLTPRGRAAGRRPKAASV